MQLMVFRRMFGLFLLGLLVVGTFQQLGRGGIDIGGGIGIVGGGIGIEYRMIIFSSCTISSAVATKMITGSGHSQSGWNRGECDVLCIIIFVVTTGLLLVLLFIMMYTLFGCRCCIYCLNCIKAPIALCRLKKKYHSMKIQDLYEEEFIAHLNAFTNLLTSVKYGGARFNFKQRYTHNMVLNKVEILRRDDYQQKIFLKGNDYLGDWEANGGFIQTEEGPFFWMFKEYENKDEAGQTGDWHTLVYESRYCRGDKADGVWFYEGFENSTQYAGKWSIVGQHFNQHILRERLTEASENPVPNSN